MSDQMKPACAIYVLHSRQEQSRGDQDLIKFLIWLMIHNVLLDLEQDPISLAINI